MTLQFGQIRRSTVFLLLALVVCLLIGITRGGGGGPELRLRAIDAMGAAGEPIAFGARVTRRGAFGTERGVPGISVTFLLEGRSIGGAMTDADGNAHFALRTNGTGHYFIEARADASDGRELATPVHVTAIATTDTVLFVDVDRSIARPQSWIQPWLRRYTEYDAAPWAAEVLTSLSEDYYLIYVTDRSRRYAESTRNWLEANGFPPAPVYHKNWEFYGGSLSIYKRSIVDSILGIASAEHLAIGSSTQDARIYRGAGIATLILESHRDPGVLPHGAIAARSWAEIPRLTRRTP